MKKNVLFITRKWSPAVGGMETYCVELTKSLKSLVNLRVEKLPGRVTGAPPSFFAIVMFGMATAFRIIFSSNRYDVLHGSDIAVWPLVYFGAIKSPNATLVLSAHGTDISLASKQGIAAAIYKQYVRLGATLMKRCHVIANSRATASLLHNHNFQNIEIIPLGTECIPEAPKSVTPENYILFVGRLLPQKGCRWFAEEVLPHLPEQISLKVAGTVVCKAEKNAIEHPRIEFLGCVFGQALREIRQKALAVIVPNIGASVEDFEGFGLTALEAAAAGGVVIASDLHGISDAVVDGKTGFLVPGGDVEAWVQKILEIQNMELNERQEFCQKSIANIAETYSWQRVAEKTLALYDGAAKHIAHHVQPVDQFQLNKMGTTQ